MHGIHQVRTPLRRHFLLTPSHSLLPLPSCTRLLILGLGQQRARHLKADHCDHLGREGLFAILREDKDVLDSRHGARGHHLVVPPFHGEALELVVNEVPGARALGRLEVGAAAALPGLRGPAGDLSFQARPLRLLALAALAGERPEGLPRPLLVEEEGRGPVSAPV